MKVVMAFEYDLNLKATDLKLGLHGTHEPKKDIVSNTKHNKRALSELIQDRGSKGNYDAKQETAPASNAQIVVWPPARSFGKNNLQMKKTEIETGIYVKVSMDGAPYLRKVDLNVYNGYPQLLKGIIQRGKATKYEDKEGDSMLVGDVPDMFISSYKRLRIIKGSEARGYEYGP